MTSVRYFLALLAVAAWAGVAEAQGPGIRGGVSVDPDQFYFGGHYETGALVDRLHFTDSEPLCVYVQDKEGYRNLCRLISLSRLSNPKGRAGMPVRELLSRSSGLAAVLPQPVDTLAGAQLAEAFPGRFYIGVHRGLYAGDEAKVAFVGSPFRFERLCRIA